MKALVIYTSQTGFTKRYAAIWNYPDGDFVYFDGEISKIEYSH